MVEAERHVGDQVSVEKRYYISSLDNDAERFGEAEWSCIRFSRAQWA
jgi:hypothetical protein